MRNQKSVCRRWAYSLLACWLLACAWSSAQAQAYEVVDQRGVRVPFAQAPQRIVSMLPSLTEAVCSLGRCAALVGVDRFSNWPDSVRTLPQVGGLDDASVEAIVALRPDLVLLARSARITQRLEGLGIRVLVLEPKNQADVQHVLRIVGDALQVPPEQGAQALWHRIEEGMAAAARSLPPYVHGTRVYFEVSRGPYAAGAVSFIGETLARLGVQNIVPKELGPFPKLNPEFVVRANPDLIMVGERNIEGMAQRPGWGAIRAVREQRICQFTPAESDVLVRPGPRMAEAAQLMARCLIDKAPH